MKSDPVKDYAERLYMRANCTGKKNSYSDTEIIDCRVRAFMDGVYWAKRKAKADATAKTKWARNASSN